MKNPASGLRRGHGATDGPAVAALFGAAVTVVVLAGVVAIADAPRSLADDARLPVSAETFEVMPPSAPELPSQVHAAASAGGQLDDAALQITYDTHA